MVWLIAAGVAVILLVRFPRQVLSIVGIIIVLGCLAGLAIWYQSTMAAKQTAAISAAAQMSPARCPDPATPILLTFYNGASRVLDRISFEIVGHRPGFSGAVIDNYGSWDKIMKPGETWSVCWASRTYDYQAVPPANTVWTVEVSASTFE